MWSLLETVSGLLQAPEVHKKKCWTFAEWQDVFHHFCVLFEYFSKLVKSEKLRRYLMFYNCFILLDRTVFDGSPALTDMVGMFLIQTWVKFNCYHISEMYTEAFLTGSADRLTGTKKFTTTVGSPTSVLLWFAGT